MDKDQMMKNATYRISLSGQSLGGIGFRGASPQAATWGRSFLPCTPTWNLPRLGAKGGLLVVS